MIRVASDVGGTFTDLVYFEIDEHSGTVRDVQARKVHTTPPNFEEGVMSALAKTDVSLNDVNFFAHGSTVVINALTERKGAKTGLITTRGFRDTLEIARGNRPDFFNIRYRKPEPFVPRYLRREITERLNYRGEIIEPVQLDELDETIEFFATNEVEAIAVSLLHSYANPEHELAIVERIKSKWPDVSIVASHQISREWREYERSNTAVVCAYVQPVAEAYLENIEKRLVRQDFRGNFYVMQSNGGIDTVSRTKKTPISIVESGPASGVLGAAALGKSLGIKNLIAFDIGGTTAKCSLIDNGEVTITSKYMIERSAKSAGYPIMTPVVDIVEIGNGGGSIGWVDDQDKLHVGPKSAGARPGPVAYGQGGVEPTTTDANLMLGRINPDYFIGGETQADMHAVHEAFATLGNKIGIDKSEAARGVVRIANHNMINALKLVSVNRGYDPRDFVIVAFGGGGAMHACELAAELNIPKVIVPAHAAVFSAWGMLMSDLRRDYVQTRPSILSSESRDNIEEVFQEMEAQALAAFEEEGISRDRIRFERGLSMRYVGQEHSARVPVPSENSHALDIDALIEDFKASYERTYSYRLENQVEAVNYSLIAYACVDQPVMSELKHEGVMPGASKGEREVDFDQAGTHLTDIFDRSKLGGGAQINGPAIIEESGSTTVVFPGQVLTVDKFGNLHIEI